MKKFALPAIAAALVLAVAAGGAFALTSNDDDAPTVARESADEDTGTDGGDALGICAEGVTDCVDAIVDPEEPVSNDGGAAGDTCPVGTADCNDTPGDLPVSEPNPGSGGGSSGLPAPDDVIAKVSDDLASRTGAEVVIVSLEAVDWPDTSLGNPQGEMFYAQVITPGYKIVLASGGANYEYHTDLAGNYTLLD
jgi:hypothetical protein